MLQRIVNWWHYTDKVIATIAATVVLALVVIITLVAGQPSCADQGLVRVEDGTTTTYIMINNVMMPIQTKKYKCVSPD